ncbi:hypothetical protein [Streptomyces hydrogenans]|uniref:hypothetical protein n=1 Tax=Streptomyces hydrogenans TaxID=1873719 RepID=UPI0037FD5EAB
MTTATDTKPKQKKTPATYHTDTLLASITEAAVKELSGWEFAELSFDVGTGAHDGRPVAHLLHTTSQAPVSLRPVFGGTHLVASIQRNGRPAYSATVRVGGIRQKDAAKALATAVTDRLVPAYQGKQPPIRPSWVDAWEAKAAQEREAQAAARQERAKKASGKAGSNSHRL